jgi:hypothetical protein
MPRAEPARPSFEELALAFRAYVEVPGDVAASLAYFELPEGLADRVVGELERTAVAPPAGRP